MSNTSNLSYFTDVSKFTEEERDEFMNTPKYLELTKLTTTLNKEREKWNQYDIIVQEFKKRIEILQSEINKILSHQSERGKNMGYINAQICHLQNKLARCQRGIECQDEPCFAYHSSLEKLKIKEYGRQKVLMVDAENDAKFYTNKYVAFGEILKTHIEEHIVSPDLLIIIYEYCCIPDNKSLSKDIFKGDLLEKKRREDLKIIANWEAVEYLFRYVSLGKEIKTVITSDIRAEFPLLYSSISDNILCIIRDYCCSEGSFTKRFELLNFNNKNESECCELDGTVFTKRCLYCKRYRNEGDMTALWKYYKEHQFVIREGRKRGAKVVTSNTVMIPIHLKCLENLGIIDYNQINSYIRGDIFMVYKSPEESRSSGDALEESRSSDNNVSKNEYPTLLNPREVKYPSETFYFDPECRSYNRINLPRWSYTVTKCVTKRDLINGNY